MKVCIDPPLVAVSLVFALFASISFGQRLTHTEVQPKKSMTPVYSLHDRSDSKGELLNLDTHDLLHYPPTITQNHVLELWGIADWR